MRVSVAAALLFGLAVTQAQATPELDREFALETVGYLRAWDNVDGLFGDYVASAYKDFFSRQSRFVLQDISKAEPILTSSKIPYNKLIQDPEVMSQLARSMRAESLIRTRILKEGPEYRFTLEWLHSPKMEVMSTDTFSLSEPVDGKAFGISDVQTALELSLARMIGKVPFYGAVTGRDGSSVTLNIGSNSNLKIGDAIEIATLDEVKKHPLLKTIVDWHLVRTGRIIVDQVDERMSFCHVVEEVPGREISRYQKVVQIIPATPTPPPILVETPETETSAPPHLGWISGGLLGGSFGRTHTASDSTGGVNGGGTFFGTQGSGELWLTSLWFVRADLLYGFSGYSQTYINGGAATPATGVSGSLFDFRGEIGYSILASPQFFGPKSWIKLGYDMASYSLPNSTTEFTAPISFGAPYLGIGGDLPLRSNWGIHVNLNFGIITSATESAPVTGIILDANDVVFSFGVSYKLAPRLNLVTDLGVLSHGADYQGGTGLSQKVITITPSLLYYF